MPVVGKWAVYNARDRNNANVKRFGAPYEYAGGLKKVKKRKIVDEEGRVIIQPRNIQSHPVKHGKYNSTYGHTINPYPKYMPDVKPDSYLKRKAKRDKWNNLYNNVRGGPFISNVYPRRVINTDQSIYGYKRTKVKEVSF